MINEQRPAAGACGSYVEWSAVLAGAVLALAISTVLMQFGSAIGLAVHSPYRTEELTSGGALAIGGWMLWVQVLSSFAGGYLTGRLRAPVSYSSDHERETRDGMHGLLSWATATIAVVIAAAAAGAFAALTAHDPETAKITPDVEHIRHNTAVIFAFITGSVSLISGVGAWWAATKGGEHRDSPTAHNHYVTFRR